MKTVTDNLYFQDYVVNSVDECKKDERRLVDAVI
jgi:hypothetical protein